MRTFLLPLCLILSLAACQSRGPVVYDYKMPEQPGGRMCVSQCRNAHEKCEDVCKFQERSCTNDMQSQAIRDYEAYVRQQFMDHAKVELRPRDFEKREKCEATDCRKICQAKYDDCFVECGGHLSPKVFD